MADINNVNFLSFVSCWLSLPFNA